MKSNLAVWKVLKNIWQLPALGDDKTIKLLDRSLVAQCFVWYTTRTMIPHGLHFIFEHILSFHECFVFFFTCSWTEHHTQGKLVLDVGAGSGILSMLLGPECVLATTSYTKCSLGGQDRIEVTAKNRPTVSSSAGVYQYNIPGGHSDLFLFSFFGWGGSMHVCMTGLIRIKGLESTLHIPPILNFDSVFLCGHILTSISS